MATHNTRALERASDGRFIDLGSRLTPEEIRKLASQPFRACPECGGDGIMGMAMAMTLDGLVVMPLICPVCQGDGQVAYQTAN